MNDFSSLLSQGTSSAWLFIPSAILRSVRHASKRWKGFGDIARRAPYFSSALIAVVGIYMAFHGLHGLNV